VARKPCDRPGRYRLALGGRSGWPALWQYRSRGRWRGGRPRISGELRHLIGRMARENFLWGAPRIHGELMMLGFTVSQATVSRYMPPTNRRPGQSWRTFIRNQAISFGHTRSLKQESAAEFLGLSNRSSVGGETECAGLKATPHRCATRSRCSIPARRLDTAPLRSGSTCDSHDLTQDPMRSPPYRARASPRLRRRAWRALARIRF
jgi:hypothetical protein